MVYIDKSLFSAEELVQYEALIKKGSVEVEEDDGEEKFVPPKNAKKAEVKDTDEEVKEEVDEDMKKSADKEFQDLLAKANERIETLEKSIKMKEFSEIAKKYVALGEDEEKLAKTLYDMKESNEANYNAYIDVLEKSLGLVQKTGIFAEIGKSAGDASGNSVEGKIRAKASEIMKADPNMDYDTAVSKAWDESPELVAEYEKEYNR